MATPIRFITCANHSDANRTSASPALIMTSLSCARGPKRRDNGLADVLRRALEKEKRINVAFIFGSLAQSRERAHSDVDLLVVGDVGLRAVSNLLDGAAEKVGREINPKVFTPQEFRRRKQAEN